MNVQKILGRGRSVAAPAIDKAGPRPYHFRSGPASGPATRPQEAKKEQESLANAKVARDSLHVKNGF